MFGDFFATSPKPGDEVWKKQMSHIIAKHMGVK